MSSGQVLDKNKKSIDPNVARQGPHGGGPDWELTIRSIVQEVDGRSDAG